MKKFKKLPVVSGAGRGKKIGVPTINFNPTDVDLGHGIYVCKVVFPDRCFWGVMHFGPRPVFGEEAVTLEAYLFDFDSQVNIPGNLDLEVFDYIRPVRNFGSVEAMTNEIENDVKVAKEKIDKIGKGKDAGMV